MYETSEEARQKLEGSVVLFDKQPVYVSTAGGSKGKVNLYYSHLPLKEDRPQDPKGETSERIDDPRWDFKSVGSKLGFVQAPDGSSNVLDAIHTSRVPVRHSRQGLDHRTVAIKCPTAFEHPPEWSNLIYEKNLVNTITGKFPTALEAFKLLTNNPKELKAQPIGRKLLLTWDQVGPVFLFYRLDKVAYSEDGVLFKLAPHKEYLREELVDVEGMQIASR